MKKRTVLILSAICFIILLALFIIERKNPEGGMAMLRALRQ